MATSAQRVLLIGSGKRIQINFIPALRMLPEYFTIAGIHSKTKEHYERVANEFNISPVEKLSPDAYNNIDMVIISVPMTVWPIFLSDMSARASEITLVIDTPLILHTLPLFSQLARFKNVITCEDYISFPQFTLLREVASSGLIGEVKSVRLVRNGFRYHGTSLIRSFFGFDHARTFTSHVHSPENVSLSLSFSKGRSGEIVEPYEGDAGYMEIIGASGSVTTANEQGDFTYRIEQVTEGERVKSYRLISKAKTFEVALPYWDKIKGMGVSDPFQIEKVHGLATVLTSGIVDNIHSRYHYSEALYDNYVSRTPRIASVAIPDIFVRVFGERIVRSFWYWVYWRLLTLYIRVKGKLSRTRS